MLVNLATWNLRNTRQISSSLFEVLISLWRTNGTRYLKSNSSRLVRNKVRWSIFWIIIEPYKPTRLLSCSFRQAWKTDDSVWKTDGSEEYNCHPFCLSWRKTTTLDKLICSCRSTVLFTSEVSMTQIAARLVYRHSSAAASVGRYCFRCQCHLLSPGKSL